MKQLLIFFVFLIFCSCEKQIRIDLPPYQQEYVVEGMIEQGDLPLVIITRSQGYYEPVNPETFSKFFVSNAEARVVVNGQDTIALTRICSEDLPDSLQDDARGLLNLSGGSPINFCVYVGLDSRLVGMAESSYTLLIDVEGKRITSTTYIPKPVPIDSLYFKVDGNKDSLGFINGIFQDPPENGDAFRFYTQRINSYPYGPNKGEQKDFNYTTPFGAVADDQFVNGQKIDFTLTRGRMFGSEKEDDVNEERPYFKRGDTVVVKLNTLDQGAFKYFRSYYNNLGNSGSPFATPANAEPNVTGALGVWVGYGVYRDTLVIN